MTGVQTCALPIYASRNVLPELQRVPGVGQAQLFGTERAMRIWIDPAKLVGYNLSTNDVVAAIRAQNAQVSSGTIGDLPIVAGQPINATVVVAGQLTSVDQFGATLASWFGVSDTDLAHVMPGLGNFATKKLGFL